MILNSKITFGMVSDTISQANKLKENEINDYGELDLSEIVSVDFPSDQYYRKHTKKNQIVMHHTVSGDGVLGDINWWKQTRSRIATHVIIDRNGKIYQTISSSYWAHHLGVKVSFLSEMDFDDYKFRNEILNKGAIGIELDSWGGLVEYDNKYYPAKWDNKKNKMIANISVKPIPKKNVVEYPETYRGFRFFEKYTTKQIKSLAQLLKYWSVKYNIPLHYNELMWDVSYDALKGEKGIWTHTSFRADKSDCHPDKNLIKMLKSLS